MTEMLDTHKRTHTKQNSWWLHDAKNIPLCRVCSECLSAVRATYQPELFDGHHYADVVEDRIEDDY